MKKSEANQIAGQGSGALSAPSKMPCPSWSIDPALCNVGGKLAKVEGTPCSSCYACKGNYKRYETAMRRCWANRLKGYEDPRWVEAMVTLIGESQYFRWFDAGDLQSLEMLERIAEIARQTPHTRHWLPTREYAVVEWYLRRHGSFPANLVVRVSAPRIDGPTPRTAQPTSTVHTAENQAPVGVVCPAYTRGGKCGDCRACWDPNVANVSYPLH